MEKSLVEVFVLVRRATVAVGVAGIIAGVLRSTGAKTLPSTYGGWNELTFDAPDNLGEPELSPQQQLTVD